MTSTKKKTNKPDILFISGSPRTRTCVALIDLIEQGARNAGAKTQRFLLSKKHINPCTGCESCLKTGICTQAGKTQGDHFTDDYLELKAVLERVDAVAVVAPLYFAGPPAQLKALFDRFQPYWAKRYVLGENPPVKRPAQLFVVGGSSDVHGYAPLAGIAKSALAVAGFNLEKVNNFVGYRAPADAPVLPAADDPEKHSLGELAHIRRGITSQKAFEQRALDAGGAFARYIVKQKLAATLAAELKQVEAEIAALKEAADKDEPPLSEAAPDPAPEPSTAA